jgi:MFS family permease
MWPTISSVASLLASYGLLLLANGLFGTLIGLRTKIEGFATETVGIIVAAYFLGLLLGGLRAARVVAAVGHIRSFAAFASVMSVSALAIILIVDPFAWIAFRFVAGFCMAGMVMVTESWLNGRSTNATRGGVMALYMITNYLAAGLGPLLVPLGDPGGFGLFCVASIIYSLALVPVLLTRAAAPAPPPVQALDFRALWLTSPLGLTAALAAGIVNSSFHGLAPVFAHDLGLSVEATSSFVATVVLGGLILQWPLGRLSDHTDRRNIIMVATLGTAISCAAIVWVAHGDPFWLFACGIAYGGFSFTVYSLAAAHTNDFAAPDRLIQTASGLLIAYGIGAVVGPLVTATLMGQFGPTAMFMSSGAVHGSLGLFALFRMFKRAARAPEERSPAVPLPGGQFTTGVLHNAARDAAATSAGENTAGSSPESSGRSDQRDGQ